MFSVVYTQIGRPQERNVTNIARERFLAGVYSTVSPHGEDLPERFVANIASVWQFPRVVRIVFVEVDHPHELQAAKVAQIKIVLTVRFVVSFQ